MKGSGAPALNISTTTQSELRRDKWPHPRVSASPEVGPGATVGTPGLGYPLLLCLGKSLVVILNYDLTAEQPDPYGPEPYSPGKRPRTCSPLGEGPVTPRVPEQVALS